MTVTESQKCVTSVTEMVRSQSQSQNMTKKSADRHEDCGRQNA